MGGIETGLDLASAMERVPDDVEAHAVRELLLMAETKVMAAMAARREEMKERVQT
jgi:hypothetical protein